MRGFVCVGTASFVGQSRGLPVRGGICIVQTRARSKGVMTTGIPMESKKRTTILDAVVAVLSAERAAKTSAEIHKLIEEKKLFQFNAKDPVGIVRSAIRKHLRSHGGTGQPSARLKLVDKDRYAVADAKA